MFNLKQSTKCVEEEAFALVDVAVAAVVVAAYVLTVSLVVAFACN